MSSGEDRAQLSAINDDDIDAFEPDPVGLYASVRLENLSKVSKKYFNLIFKKWNF